MTWLFRLTMTALGLLVLGSALALAQNFGGGGGRGGGGPPGGGMGGGGQRPPSPGFGGGQGARPAPGQGMASPRPQSTGGGFTYTPLHSINDQPPTGDLLLASDGRLYGTSRNGGTSLIGSVFRINTDGSGFQVIHSFITSNGAYPKAGLVQAPDGNLYGATEEGGDDNKGTIFRIDLNLDPPVVNRRPIGPDATT